MRSIAKLMKDWQFTGPNGVTAAVALPHTWNAKDGQDGGNDYWRGTCTYRTGFAAPAYDPAQQQVWLQFEGVNASATVLLNGQQLCTHDGGYSTFRAEVTGLLQAENQLTVRVDNSVNDRVYVCSVPFFLLTVRTSQKEGQKASLMKYVSVALVCYVGVLVLLLLWGRGDAFTLSILGENGLSLNLYTILFIAFFGIGYGAYYATADMPIPMVADCSDYETYRSGNYIPGIMGTLFSLVDKLVSSLSATVVGIAVSFVGLQSLPTQYDPYTPGMNWVVIVLFCIIPMVAWAATLIAMKGYTLTGAKMKEIQAVNACRRDAVAKGMKLEEAMDKWQTMEQLPEEYRS